LLSPSLIISSLPFFPLLLCPFLRIINFELRPLLIFSVTDTFEAADDFPFLGISVGHTLPIIRIFPALPAFALGIFADWAGVSFTGGG
jgi:hypothetical protein